MSRREALFKTSASLGLKRTASGHFTKIGKRGNPVKADSMTVKQLKNYARNHYGINIGANIKRKKDILSRLHNAEHTERGGVPYNYNNKNAAARATLGSLVARTKLKTGGPTRRQALLAAATNLNIRLNNNGQYKMMGSRGQLIAVRMTIPQLKEYGTQRGIIFNSGNRTKKKVLNKIYFLSQ